MRSIRHAIVTLAVAAAGAAACTTASTSIGPTVAKCQVTLAGPPAVGAAGGPAGLTVTTQPECAWSASTPLPWITGLSPSSGQGSGTVTVTVAANQLATPRQGHVLVNDTTASIVQEASPCGYQLQPEGAAVGPAGAEGRFDVITGDGCPWTARSTAPWIETASTGRGPGSVGYQVRPNPGGPREGAIEVAGLRFAIAQASGVAGCTYALGSTTLSAPATDSAGSVTVTAGTGCIWTAASHDPWIVVTSGATGSGSGSVSFSILANPGALRTGTLTIAGQVFTITQASATVSCAYAISPATATVSIFGNVSLAVTVTTAAGCAWNAVSQASWIVVTGTSSGTGSGTVSLRVLSNLLGSDRTGTVTVAGQTFTVEQAGIF